MRHRKKGEAAEKDCSPSLPTDAHVGFAHDAVVTVRIPDNDPVKRESVVQQFRNQSFVSAASCSYTLPGGINRNRSYRDIRRTDATTHADIKIYEFQSIDTAFLNLYKIKLLAGRNFQQTDSARYLVINKTLMRNLQLGEPAEAVGSSLNIDKEKYTVLGVVDDFSSNSLKEGIDNIAMEMRPGSYRELSIKLAGRGGEASLTDKLAQIEKIWKATYPEFVFDYQFMDDNINAFYAQEEKYAKLFELFSITFLLIGCLGLFGLITFVVNRKGKEIAIRKVLGASVAGLLLLFSKEYIKLILVSFVLAIPVTYYVVNDWLANFSYHIQLQWWMFATPGVIVLLVAIGVVCIKSLGAANRNPVENLKCE